MSRLSTLGLSISSMDSTVDSLYHSKSAEVRSKELGLVALWFWALLQIRSDSPALTRTSSPSPGMQRISSTMQ